MSQVTLYIPDELEARLRREAKQARMSLSAYVTALAAGGSRGGGWPEEFWSLWGKWKGQLPVPEDPPPDEPDAM